MSAKFSVFACLVMIVLSVAIGAYAYPLLPTLVVSHWNAHGVPDGHLSRFMGTFIVPMISLVIFLIIFLAPRLVPLKRNIEYVRKYYNGLAVVLMLFFLYLQAIIVLLNLGYKFNIVQFLAPAIGSLFFYLGILIRHTRRNWIAGIRTPWTLSSDEVWEKTHARSGRLFQGAGVLALFGFAFPHLAFILIFIPIVFVSLYAIVYSYFVFKKVNSIKK